MTSPAPVTLAMSQRNRSAAVRIPVVGGGSAGDDDQLMQQMHEMARRDAKRGLATLCIGGGMGIAMCVER